jgi:hypothetical protein
MNRNVLVVGLVLAMVLCVTSPAAGAARSSGWSRARFEVDATGPTPACAYTIIQDAGAAPATRQRVLFTDAQGRHLVVELKLKPGKSPDAPQSRWMNFYLLPGGHHLALAFVAGNVDVHLDATSILSTPVDHVSASQFADLRGQLPEGLAVAIDEFARIGLTREPALNDAAELLAQTLLVGALPVDLRLSAADRRALVETREFDPQTSPAVAGEMPFGALYGLPTTD